MTRHIIKTRLSEQVALQLQQEILSGQIPFGSRLPTERELAVQFRVSRPSIREALSVLQSRGLIESRQGGGTTVIVPADRLLATPINEQLSRDPSLLTNPLEVRSILEPRTTALAAERATSAEIATMANRLRAQEEVVLAGGTGIDEDTDFHFAIVQASHNDLIVTIISHINQALRESREWSLRAPSGAVNSLRHHHRILEAIRARDPQWASLAMAAHLEDVRAMAGHWLLEHERRADEPRSLENGRPAR